MNALDSRWSETVTAPDPTEWSSALILRQPFASDSREAALRTAARQRLVDAAQQYLLRMHEIAGRAEVTLPNDPVLTGDPQSQPIIMTGHQPVPFHGGLTFKYHCTEQSAASQQAIAVAVTIDTDEGDPGAFQYPQPDPDAGETQFPQFRRGNWSMCEATGLLGMVPLRPAAELQTQSLSIAGDLETTAGPEAATAFRQTAADCVRLAEAGATAAEANLILRWSRGIGSQMPDLPLSAICCLPEVLEFATGILMEPEAFATACNDGLHRFRESHGISNQANPFPDLQINADRTELPFWILDTAQGTRRPLFVSSIDGTIRLDLGDTTAEARTAEDMTSLLDRLLLQNRQLVPRGVLITSFLRLLFADLFVHGTGGGRYDEFTSEFVRSWWDVDAPPFAVASASQYLLERRRAEIHDLRQLNQDLRDLRYNPQRHFGQGVFAADVESRLQQLAQDKDDVVTALKTARQEGRSAKDLGRRIQLISDEMRDVVDQAFASQLAALEELTPETESAVDCRTYPWFLFPAE